MATTLTPTITPATGAIGAVVDGVDLRHALDDADRGSAARRAARALGAVLPRPGAERGRATRVRVELRHRRAVSAHQDVRRHRARRRPSRTPPTARPTPTAGTPTSPGSPSRPRTRSSTPRSFPSAAATRCGRACSRRTTRCRPSCSSCAAGSPCVTTPARTSANGWRARRGTRWPTASWPSSRRSSTRWSARIPSPVGARSSSPVGSWTRSSACTATRATSCSTSSRRHVENPNFCVRWRWTAGDLAIWDEASTNHRALSDHYPAHRVMRRCTVEGSRPSFTPDPTDE